MTWQFIMIHVTHNELISPWEEFRKFDIDVYKKKLVSQYSIKPSFNINTCPVAPDFKSCMWMISNFNIGNTDPVPVVYIVIIIVGIIIND